MDNQKIAIIGLGRIGSAFLRNMLDRRERVLSLDQIIALGSGVDILFDLTGIPAVRREIREKLMAQGNHHTVIASETIARLIWVMTSDDDLPVIAGRSTGY
jgi:homoserine dehydrogenase